VAASKILYISRFRPMKSFLQKSLLFLLPFVIISITYFLFDPFKVLYDYDDYGEDYMVILNRDYVSTKMFLKKREKYNSFIFGSSRTLAYKTADWATHLGEDAAPFVFDASEETIYGIWKKVKFLDEQNAEIKNALVIVCGDVTFSRTRNSEGHIFVKNPLITKESRWDFYSQFYSAYFKKFFFVPYLDYKIFRTQRPYMSGYLDFREMAIDPVSNDLIITDWETLIVSNPDAYYKERQHVFYQRPSKAVHYQPQIHEKHENMLKEIKAIFDKHNTNYQIVISPLYNQIKFNERDYQTLTSIFGAHRIHDYSGKNSITEPIINYFENSHYRYHIGRQIMNDIYK
jgi:hypothetical protein